MGSFYIFLDKTGIYAYNCFSVEARYTSVTGTTCGNMPVKGSAAEIYDPISVGRRLVLGRICPGLSHDICGELPPFVF